MSSTYDLAQTIYIDSNATAGSPSVAVTAVDLYVYSKPTQGKTVSGINAPGITVGIAYLIIVPTLQPLQHIVWLELNGLTSTLIRQVDKQQHSRLQNPLLYQLIQ